MQRGGAARGMPRQEEVAAGRPDLEAERAQRGGQPRAGGRQLPGELDEVLAPCQRFERDGLREGAGIEGVLCWSNSATSARSPMQ